MQQFKENLEEAVMDYVESCHRTGHCDSEEMTTYFMRENSHMELDRGDVYNLIRKYNED